MPDSLSWQRHRRSVADSGPKLLESQTAEIFFSAPRPDSPRIPLFVIWTEREGDSLVFRARGISDQFYHTFQTRFGAITYVEGLLAEMQKGTTTK